MGPVICEWLLSLPECHKMTWTPEWLAKFFLSDKNTADKALDLHLDDCATILYEAHYHLLCLPQLSFFLLP